MKHVIYGKPNALIAAFIFWATSVTEKSLASSRLIWWEDNIS